MTWYTLHCKVYNFIIICSLIWQRSQETLAPIVLSLLDSDQINQQQVKLAESLHQYVVTGHSSLHWSDDELGNQGFKLTRPIIIVKTQLSQPIPIPTTLEPPALHPSSSSSGHTVPKAPSPGDNSSMSDSKKSQHQISWAWHGMAWHGASRGGSCAWLRWAPGIGKAKKAIVYLCHNRAGSNDRQCRRQLRVSSWQNQHDEPVLGFRSPAEGGQSS